MTRRKTSKGYSWPGPSSESVASLVNSSSMGSKPRRFRLRSEVRVYPNGSASGFHSSSGIAGKQWPLRAEFLRREGSSWCCFQTAVPSLSTGWSTRGRWRCGFAPDGKALADWYRRTTGRRLPPSRLQRCWHGQDYPRATGLSMARPCEGFSKIGNPQKGSKHPRCWAE